MEEPSATAMLRSILSLTATNTACSRAVCREATLSTPGSWQGGDRVGLPPGSLQHSSHPAGAAQLPLPGRRTRGRVLQRRGGCAVRMCRLPTPSSTHPPTHRDVLRRIASNGQDDEAQERLVDAAALRHGLDGTGQVLCAAGAAGRQGGRDARRQVAGGAGAGHAGGRPAALLPPVHCRARCLSRP